MKSGIELIAEERQRQIEQEGCDAKHDSQYNASDLAEAGAAYALCDNTLWPWDRKYWKPTNRRRDWAKAGALIAAAIDRHGHPSDVASPATVQIIWDQHHDICDKLHQAVQTYGLGSAGDDTIDVVLAELRRLRAKEARL